MKGIRFKSPTVWWQYIINRDATARSSQIRPLYYGGGPTLPPQRSILQNPGKTAILPVLPSLAPLNHIAHEKKVFLQKKVMMIKYSALIALVLMLHLLLSKDMYG